jgi:hypothetical protein
MSTKTILFNHKFENSCGDDVQTLFIVFLNDGYVEYKNQYLSLMDVVELFEKYVKPVDGHISKEDIVNFFKQYSCVVEFVTCTVITKYNFGVQ